MNVQLRLDRFLSNKMVLRIVSLFLTGVLALSAYMSGTLAWTAYVSRVNTFFGGAPGSDKGLMIRKTVHNAEDPQPTEEELDRLVFSFLVEIPSITEPVVYIVYDRTGQIASEGLVSPNGDINDPDSIIRIKGGQYAVITDLPLGTWYRISEIPLPGYETDSVGSSGHFIKTDDGATIADFTNTYYTNGAGVLELRKTLNIESEMLFDFDVRFELNGEIYDGPLLVEIDGGELREFVNPGLIMLTNRGYARFINLPPGLKYIITEMDYSDDNFYPAAGSFTGFTSAGCDPIIIDADNCFIDTSNGEKGSISITKRVTGASLEIDRGFKFIVSFEDANNIFFDGVSDSGLRVDYDDFSEESDSSRDERREPDSESNAADSEPTDPLPPESEETESIPEDSESVSDETDQAGEQSQPPDPDSPSEETDPDTPGEETEPASEAPETAPDASDEETEPVDKESADTAVETDNPNPDADEEPVPDSEASETPFSETGADLFENGSVSEFQSAFPFEDVTTLSSSALDIAEFFPEFQSDGSVRSSVDGVEGNSYYITLYPGETALFGNIPEGVKYTVTEVTEDNPDGYISSNESVSGIIIGLVNKPLTFVNHKPGSAKLRVMKQTIGAPDEDINKIFTVWMYINGVMRESPIQLRSGDVSADIEIPIGAYYELVEENYADDGYLTYVEHATGLALVNTDITTRIINYYNTVSPTPITTTAPSLTVTQTPSNPPLTTYPVLTVTARPTESGRNTPTNTPRPTDSGEITPRPTDSGDATPTNTPRPTDSGGATPTNTPRPTDPGGATPTNTATPDNPTQPPYETNSPTVTRPPYVTDPPATRRPTRPTQPPVNPPYYTNSPTPMVNPPYFTTSPPFEPTTVPIFTPTPEYPFEVTNTPTNVYPPEFTYTPTPEDSIPPDITEIPGQGGGTPNTGDNTNPAPWFTLMIVSALLLRYVLSNKPRLLGR
ncbi:MAG: DUF5979 domain-containing protein [Clostridiales bacterium]|jgi:hypothetical protein|nr:DUF5979 domain-containing protein [Clostridiales bacterium]